jgi:translation initiation factor 2 alpha subunit (eIF-2alpha)
MKKTGMPRPGEVVVCRIKSINPNSVFARLEEYDKEGMIHVSEVA